MTILNTTTKRSYNVALPDDEIVENLTVDRVNDIINKKFSKK
jgi:hypothetical protein